MSVVLLAVVALLLIIQQRRHRRRKAVFKAMAERWNQNEEYLRRPID
jgi:ABC-type Fe3+ transport system permease subunit